MIWTTEVDIYNSTRGGRGASDDATSGGKAMWDATKVMGNNYDDTNKGVIGYRL